MSFFNKLTSAFAKKEQKQAINTTYEEPKKQIIVKPEPPEPKEAMPTWELTELTAFNIQGVYKCKNFECEQGYRYLKYLVPNPPDVANCPFCGKPMIHEKLIDDYYRFTNAVLGMGSGNQEGFEVAKRTWNIFVRYYKAINNDVWKLEIPVLDYIFDITSKISFPEVTKEVNRDFPCLNLERYPQETILYISRLLQTSTSFLYECVSTEPQKQVDLVKELEGRLSPILEEMQEVTGINHPNYSDGKYYFYVWRKFGIVKCERQGRYNMIRIS